MSSYLPSVIRFDQVRPRPIRWLWEPYLARGKLALLDGDPGAGKSLFTADLAARLSRGRRLPDGSRPGRKARVLFLNAEDGLDETLRPRLQPRLADRPRAAKEFLDEGEAAGYCARTLERAKKRLGIVAERVQSSGRAAWFWAGAAASPNGADERR